MGEYARYNAQNVLDEVNKHIAELENIIDRDAFWANRERYDRHIKSYRDLTYTYKFYIKAVYRELSIFDWWNETLSMSQLKQMKKFLETAIKLGFNGYVCFKVGAAGCTHGMWAYKEESTDGYSPDCDTLFHSFRSGDNYWDVKVGGKWLRDTLPDVGGRYKFTLKEVKSVLKEVV